MDYSKVNKVEIIGNKNLVLQDIDNSSIIINFQDTEELLELLKNFDGKFDSIFEKLDKTNNLTQVLIENIERIKLIKDELSVYKNQDFNIKRIEETLDTISISYNDFNANKLKILIESDLPKIENLEASSFKNHMLLKSYTILSRIYEFQGMDRAKGSYYMKKMYTTAILEKTFNLAVAGINHFAINNYNLLFSAKDKRKHIQNTLKIYNFLVEYLESTELKINRDELLALKCNALHSHSAVLTLNGNYNIAEKKLFDALSIASDIGNESSILSSHLHLGNLYSATGDFKKAQKYFDLAANDVLFTEGIKVPIFYKYYSLFSLQSGELKEAQKYIDVAYSLAKKYNMIDQLKQLSAIKQNYHNKDFLKNPFSISIL